MDGAGLLVLLRGLSFAALAALSGSLFWLLVVRGVRLSRPVWRAWLVAGVVKVGVTVTSGFFELLELVSMASPQSPLISLGKRVYNLAFLFNGVLDAVFPFAVLVLVVRSPRFRRLSVALAAVVVGTGAWWALAGASSDWNVLLTATQIIAFLGIAGYFAFCGLWVLGRLPQADAYLAGFVAISALFNVLLPVQEVFFQLVGRASVEHIWHINQFLQFAQHAGHLAIVLALGNALARRERPAPSVPTVG